MKVSFSAAFLSLILSGEYLCDAFAPAGSKFGIVSNELDFSLDAIRRRGGPRQPRRVEEKPPMNLEVPNIQLRVVTPNPKGKDDPLGIMGRAEALSLAKDMGGLDLVLINAKSDPPVCKIVDYSKFRYEKERKAKMLKKNSKATEVKEVKMSYKIDVHDYNVRKKNASKFIGQGNRVKCTIMFKGREIQHDKLGVELLGKLATDLEDVCLMEGKPKREGRNLSCILTPRPEVVKKINEKKRAEEKKKRKAKEQGKKEFEEKQAKKAAAKGVTANAANGGRILDFDSEDSLDDLDELLKGDDLTDDLFG